MEIKHSFKVIILSIFLPVCFSWAQLTGPFFNEPFPSTTVTRFAPNIFTEEFHAPPIFSPTGDEVYWSLMNSQPSNILFMRLANGIWTSATVAPFSSSLGSDSPFISSDGTRLVFLSRDSLTNRENICIVEKNNGVWGTPDILGNEVNQFRPHWQASIADNQNLYFGGMQNGGGNIYFSEYVNGSYTSAQNPGSAINTNDGYETSPFIAPDESYLIFARVQGSSPYSDLFISSKQNDGSWSEAVYMSELNTGAHELYANVSPNGQFIMFLSGRTGILLPYWVDAQIINNYITSIDHEKKAGNPKSFQLHQNYPNPFNPSTSITYQLPVSNHISLKIYNVLGHEICTLVNETKSAGEYVVKWKARDYPSGIYFYQIKTGKFMQTKRMLLLR